MKKNEKKIGPCGSFPFKSGMTKTFSGLQKVQRIRSFRSCGINFSNALPFSRTLQFYFFHCQRHSANTFQFLILTHLLPRVHDPTFSQGPGGIIQGSSGGAGPSGTQVSILAHHCILHFKLPPSFYTGDPIYSGFKK